ncbi:MAG: T9SS type A sorting domain-containing protein [Candidatus Marinimicrobia bacterium]|nr:T9SS type A sorting domain-containing protein [Candidatus Neomarinimicrobiota bacterium]
MKRIILVFLMLISYLYCTDYINVHITTGDKHEELSNIKKIYFDGSNVKFELNNGYVDTESMDDIINITFGETPLGDQSLPVELVSFTAVQSGKNITLFWETASEVNNLGFDIERIHDGVNEWENIGFEEGNGSVSSSSEYCFCDKNIEKFHNIQYRLKQIDYDGSFEYSRAISVMVEEVILPDQFRLHNNYPNPFNPETTISYEIVKENITILKVYDILGNEVEVLVNQNQTPGRYNVKFNGSSLSSGVYFCKLESGNYSKLIKMLLVK